MSTTGLFASLIIVVAFLLWVILPLLRSPHRQAAEIETSTIKRQRERLQVYYERVLRNLHDLDEDHATGKLNPEEYHPERERWVQRGIQALKAIGQLDAQHLIAPTTADEATIDASIDDAIEAAVRKHLDQAAGA
jgi:hypothetical protein